MVHLNWRIQAKDTLTPPVVVSYHFTHAISVSAAIEEQSGMRSPFLCLTALLLTGLPLQAALDFNAGNFGTFGMSNTILNFTPTGGVGPTYTFSYAPGAIPIPNFRVTNRPELQYNAAATVMGALVGLPLTPGLQSTTIRCFDNGSGLFIDKAVSFTVTSLDLAGFGPGYYSIGDTVNQRFWPVGGAGGYTYTLTGTLPPGLSLSSQVVNGQNVALVTGQIANTATTATISGNTVTTNQYNFTIVIHDSSGASFSRGFNMVVSAMQLTVNAQPLNAGNNRVLPAANVGLAYNQQIGVVGGTAPFHFSLPFLNAPPNTLQLSSTGQITGTPTGSTFFGN